MAQFDSRYFEKLTGVGRVRSVGCLMNTFTFNFAAFPSLLVKTSAPMNELLHSSGLDSAFVKIHFVVR